MGTVITWIIVFAILCGCIFAWCYMLHRGPHANEGNDSASCDGDCLHCASNSMHNISRTPDNCEVSRPASPVPTRRPADESSASPEGVAQK